MKIALYGPSGTGKTTLAKIIAEEFNLKYIPGSSYSELLNDDQKAVLKGWGYAGGGHKEIIKLSASNPLFGELFQNFVLEQRSLLFTEEDSFVTDRSPIDNLTYFLLQNSAQISEENTQVFIGRCQSLFRSVSHAIGLTPLGMDFVEDNKSRVNNLQYQKMVSSVFEHVFNTYFSKTTNVKHLLVTPRNLELRVQKVIQFIEI